MNCKKPGENAGSEKKKGNIFLQRRIQHVYNLVQAAGYARINN